MDRQHLPSSSFPALKSHRLRPFPPTVLFLKAVSPRILEDTFIFFLPSLYMRACSAPFAFSFHTILFSSLSGLEFHHAFVYPTAACLLVCTHTAPNFCHHHTCCCGMNVAAAQMPSGVEHLPCLRKKKRGRGTQEACVRWDSVSFAAPFVFCRAWSHSVCFFARPLFAGGLVFFLANTSFFQRQRQSAHAFW